MSARPEKLLEVTTGRLRADRDTLIEALHGRVRSSRRFLLKAPPGANRSAGEIDRGRRHGGGFDPRSLSWQGRSTDHHARHQRRRRAGDRLGDRGRHESFPDGWALGFAGWPLPQNDESAGKRCSTRLRQGAPWLKVTLVQCAWSAARAKTGYLPAQFLRIKSRRGPKKAIMAVAASMLTAAYYMLRDDVDYRDLGTDYFHRTDGAKAAKRLVKRLGDLGYTVEIKKAA